MTRQGRVAALFRYPVKSMQGESLERVEVDDLGIVGDRLWAVRDERRGDFSTGKRVARLLDCRAETTREGGIPEIVLPGGDRVRADDPDAADRLSAALDHPVTLWPIGANSAPAEDVEEVVDPAADFRAMMARIGDEPNPDFSQALEAFAGFLGHAERPFVDLSPLMVMTQESLATIARSAPDSRIDVRRFRPSLLVEAEDDAAFPEQDWIGQHVRIGGVELDLPMTCPRCVMTTHGFADLPKDPSVMRKLVSEAEGNLGVYATIVSPGEIRVGDPVGLID